MKAPEQVIQSHIWGGWNHSVSRDDRTQNKIHLNDFVNIDHKDFLLNWVLSTKIYFPVPYNGVEMEKCQYVPERK